MRTSQEPESLLALDPGVRESGWAWFQGGRLKSTGRIALPKHLKLTAEERIDHLTAGLDRLVAEGVAVEATPAGENLAEVVCAQPSGIRWPVPSLELLETRLALWSQRQGLARHSYTAQEVRRAFTGSARTSRDRLAYAVMASLGLIGQTRTTHEWEAVAVGYYHLALRGYPASSVSSETGGNDGSTSLS